MPNPTDALGLALAITAVLVLLSCGSPSAPAPSDAGSMADDTTSQWDASVRDRGRPGIVDEPMGAKRGWRFVKVSKNG